MRRLQNDFLAFAREYSFLPRACHVRAAWEKGKIERSVGYLRQSFWPLRTFTDLSDVNLQVRQWLQQVLYPCVYFSFPAALCCPSFTNPRIAPMIMADAPEQTIVSQKWDRNGSVLSRMTHAITNTIDANVVRYFILVSLTESVHTEPRPHAVLSVLVSCRILFVLCEPPQPRVATDVAIGRN